MESAHQFLLFLSIATLLNITPGADHVYIVSRTVAQGRLAGFLSSWGVCTGAMAYVIATALGISAVIASSETAFLAIKLMGAGYLIWLGIQALRSRGMSFQVDTGIANKTTSRQLYLQGVLVDILNPKVAIFFIAFLPQFVDPSKGAAWWQMIVLGTIVVVIASICEAMLILGAGEISKHLRNNKAIGKWLDRALGCVFISLGLSLAFGD
ncbi:LysE family translocator [Salinisphaera sp. USBA-960]|nr:LysE family translocator [Salifodinibacter halophilus]NNC26155.1 LysE family translocator [Salifodinibacter halophilus]